MDSKQSSILNLFVLVSGLVIVVQFFPMPNRIQAMGIDGVGTISGEAVLAMLFMILALAVSLVLMAGISLLPHRMRYLEGRFFRIFPLLAGAALMIFGLLTINLSASVRSGVQTSIVPIGIELFSLGTLSMALFVDRMGDARLINDVPNYAFLLFFLSLIPAAFLIMT